jgi:transglutaminase-like putative cysteine protease
MERLFTLRSIISIILLMISSSALVSGVKAGVQGMEDASFLHVAVFAILSGYALGHTKISTRRTWVALLLAGLFVIFIEAGRLREPLVESIRYIPKFEVEFLQSLFKKEAADASFFQIQFAEIKVRSNIFISSLLRDGAANPATREALWDLPIYLLAAWSAWWTGRYNIVLTALMPSLTLHGYILYYTGQSMFSLQAAVFALVSLLGVSQRWNVHQNKNTGIEKARRETYSTVMVLSMTLAILAGFMPSISLKDIRDKLAEENKVAESLGLDREIAQSFITTGLPRQHLVGLEPATSQSIVFTVETGELPPTDKNIITEPVPRHYWRWLTYDIYSGQGWDTSPIEKDSHSANETMFAYQGVQYRTIHQRVEKTSPQDDRLYWTGALIRANQPFETSWRVSPKSLNPAVDPLLAADLLGSLTKAQIYTADSLYPVVSETQLRASPDTYPEDIYERYLSLPETVTERVTRLANDVTVNIDNPYDKARAIEAYLRNFPYSLNVPAPPSSQDVADYFLFDLKRGYCDYYATSMVVMARAAGLPARLVIGYSSGEYAPVSAAYIVREQDAHSWVEIYFTGVGWVEFEPTASLPSIMLPVELPDETSETMSPSQNKLSYESARLKSGLTARKSFRPGNVGILIVSILIPAWFLHKEGFLRSHASIGSIFGYVYLHGKRIYKDAPLHETPSAFADNLKRKLRAGHKWLGTAQDEIDHLTRLYLQEIYSAHPVTRDERKNAIRIWRILFWRLLIARFIAL